MVQATTSYEFLDPNGHHSRIVIARSVLIASRGNNESKISLDWRLMRDIDSFLVTAQLY